MKKKHVIFYIDSEKAKRLKRLSAKTKIPAAPLIRKELVLLLNKHEKKLKDRRKKRSLVATRMDEKMTMILRSIYLEEEQVKSIMKLHKTTRVPQAVLIREGVDMALDKHEQRLKRKRKKRGGA